MHEPTLAEISYECKVRLATDTPMAYPEQDTKMIALAELKRKSCSDSEAVVAIRACIARSTERIKTKWSTRPHSPRGEWQVRTLIHSCAETGGVEGGSAHEWDGKHGRVGCA